MYGKGFASHPAAVVDEWPRYRYRELVVVTWGRKVVKPVLVVRGMARHFGLDCVSNGIGFFVGVEEAAYGGDGFDHIARIRDPVLIFDTGRGHSGM